MITLYNVCLVHREMFSTSGDVQYIGRCSVHRGVFSTSGVFITSEGYHEYIGGYHDACGGYHEYIGECSVHWGDTMSTLGGYHEYIGGIS